MAKLPACDRCLLSAHDPHLVCALHPVRGEGDRCPDFELDLNVGSEELWQLVGGSYYNGELILYRPTLSQAEQLALLDWHPLFTGRCPECERAIAPPEPLTVHWDCIYCGWKNDSM